MLYNEVARLGSVKTNPVRGKKQKSKAWISTQWILAVPNATTTTSRRTGCKGPYVSLARACRAVAGCPASHARTAIVSSTPYVSLRSV